MRLIGLTVILSLTLAPLAAGAQSAEKRKSTDFPGGVAFVERIDEMTDERICSVHTPMRGVEAVVSGTSVAFFIHERLGPVVRYPTATLRLGLSKPIKLTATDRPYLIAVPKDRTRETIEALYTQSRIIVRWYDLRKDPHTITLEIGDFGAAYDHGVASCGWPRLAVKRGAFVSPLAAITPDVSDFPYACNIRQVQQKIQERWNGRAIPGGQPIVVLEIGRDGRINQVMIDKSSGNVYYDQVALRAINDAGPFPPLPVDFKKSTLTIKLQLGFEPSSSVIVLLSEGPDQRSGIEGEPISLDSRDSAYGVYLDRVRRMIKEKAIRASRTLRPNTATTSPHKSWSNSASSKAGLYLTSRYFSHRNGKSTMTTQSMRSGLPDLFHQRRPS